MEKNEQKLQKNKDVEIDLAEILRQIWSGRWTIIITTVAFVTLGIIYLIYSALTEIKEYESQVTVMAESPMPDSLISLTKNPLFISEVLKMKLNGLRPGPALTVAEVLNQRTRPAQGNLDGLANRINAIKGSAGVLVITVKMQDPSVATQLADSLVQKLAQFLKETQLRRAEKNRELLEEDTAKNFQILRESISRNLQYLEKGTLNSIQFLTEGSAKDIRYLLKGNSKNMQFLSEGSLKEIEFQKEGSNQDVQFQKESSIKSIQFLTEGFLKAESTYLKSQQALADYIKQNAAKMQFVDSIEVKKLNSDIKLKFNVYSDLYQQLEQAKIEAKKQGEQVTLDSEKQLEQAKIDADKQIEHAKLEADNKLELAKLEMDKHLDQVKLDAEKQIEQAKLDAEKQLIQAKIDIRNQLEKVLFDAEKKIPVINVLEKATDAVQSNVSKTKKVLLLTIIYGLIIGIGIIYGKKFYVKNFAGTTQK